MAVNDLQQRFWAFHAANPHVYALLVRLARELRSRGHERTSIKMLFEVCRWQYLMTVQGDGSGFLLNNNYHSYYARLIMQTEADLDDLFEVRPLTAGETFAVPAPPPSGATLTSLMAALTALLEE